MNKIINLVFTIILLSLILLVYLKIDEITDFFTGFMSDEKTVEVKEKNEYARDFDYVKFQNDDKFIPVDKESILNIFYNIFNDGYDEFTFYCPKEYDSCISDIKELTKEKITFSKINDYVHPYNSFKDFNVRLYTNGKVVVSVIKNYSSNEIEELNKRVDDILYELNISSISNTTDKIRSIHNYIIKNVEYDEKMANNNTSSYRSNTAYGALVQGYAICTGYSDAMALFLDELDIPNIKISSDEHVWNLVYLNGSWVHLDLTWNDTNNPKYQMSYFLIDTDTLFKLDPEEHLFDESFYLEA